MEKRCELKKDENRKKMQMNRRCEWKKDANRIKM